MNAATYGKLVNGEIEHVAEVTIAQVALPNKSVDSWHGLPLIQGAINLYTDMKLLGYLYNGGTFLISYQGIQYTLTDNGGEITIHKVNDKEYFREFPTVYHMGSLNGETLMYRLLQTLKGEAIDYEFREEDFHHIMKAS